MHYFQWFLVPMLLYIGIILYRYRKKNLTFLAKITRIRMWFYFIVCIEILIGWVLGNLYPSNWQYSFGLFISGVLVDLAIFQTPSVVKIFNAEFKDVKLFDKLIEQNVQRNDAMLGKTTQVSNIVQKCKYYFKTKPLINNYDDYELELGKFLKQYIDLYGYAFSIFKFAEKSMETEWVDIAEEDYTWSIKDVLQRMYIRYSINFTNEDIEDKVTKLLKPEMEVIQYELPQNLSLNEVERVQTKALLVPYYGETYGIIFVLERTRETVWEVDAPLLIILTSVFEAYTRR